MGLANPVNGRIQAKGEQWKGAPNFIVTATFQEHLDSGRAAGIDIGDGRQGDAVMAMDAGTVTLAGPLGLANVVRVRHANGYTSGYAHLQTIMVNAGQAVARSQQLGTVGMTGADAPHLHGGYTNPQGQEVDWWPLLDQNQQQETDDMDLKGTPVNPIHNRKTTLKSGGALVADPTGSPYEVIASYDAGQLFIPSYLVKGNAILGTDEWYGGFEPVQRAGQQISYGYLSVALCFPLAKIEESGDTAAAERKGYNEGRGAVQAAAVAVPPK